MINLIMGRPGGGKSYEAVVYHVLPNIKDGRKVITNLPLNMEALIAVFGEKVSELIEVKSFDLHDYGNDNRPFSSPNDYKDEWRNERGQAPLYIIDEAHMILGNQAKKDLLEFYSMHRHFGIDITLLTQSDRKLHRDIRDMIEIVYRCIKNTALGSNKTYTKKVKMGLRGDVVNTEQRTYEKQYFKLYQSHTASNSAVSEAQAKDVRPLWRSKMACALYVFIILSVVGLVNVFSQDSLLGSPATPTESIQTIESTQVSTEVQEPEFYEHPLGDFNFLVTGFSESLVYVSNQIDPSKSLREYYFQLSQGDYQMNVTTGQLRSLGYQVEPINDCFARIRFQKFEQLVTCASKQKQVIEEFNPVANASLPI
ncbi:assembly protein [Vibrio mediterranei]|jgi:zona occludens toxin|uniref:zonular occludens toxin domain-containing protein n=1 Tax=Vibrio mediterranei TaxID=689 RepID=UPI0017A63AC8|nr:zonular occludens toxin domain-containing protein [Vibrio mediterranei]NUW72489.1 assembly protein [Vibrio mediterranei]